MRKILLALPLIALSLVAGTSAPATAAGPAPAPTRTLTFEGEAGAHPVDGRGATRAAPKDEIEVRGTRSVVKVDAYSADGDDLWLELRAANDAPVRPGVYRTNATRRPDGPRILVVSRGIGCVDDHATVLVSRLRRDANGLVTALDLRFEHRCGSASAPALRGTLHYRA